MSDTFDLAVIGAGPGGYVAAIRAAQLGKKVVVIDAEGAAQAPAPGGTCLNWGCIPSKALLKSAERYEFLKSAASFGFSADNIGFDLKKIVASSRAVVGKLNKGIEFLFKKNKIDYRVGRAQILMPGKIRISSTNTELSAEKILIAVGAKPRLLPGVAADGRRILTSKEALTLTSPPSHLAVLGAGAIGMEFAYFFHALGSGVTVIELLDRILPQEDPEISDRLRKIYEKKGMTFLTQTRVNKLNVSSDAVQIEIDVEGQKNFVNAGVTLLALGVVPNLDGLLAEGLKLKENKGWIEVDDDYKTSLPGIHAIGDIIGPPWLAHVASHEGVVAVERMFTEHRPKINYDAIPACTYCLPQVASIGLTEPAARVKFGDTVQVGRFPFQALGKAIASDETEGFVKLVFAGPHGQLVGAHILGHEATEMIAELGMAIALESTRDEIISIVHAHPTMSEAVLEAALNSAGRAIHI